MRSSVPSMIFRPRILIGFIRFHSFGVSRSLHHLRTLSSSSQEDTVGATSQQQLARERHARNESIPAGSSTYKSLMDSAKAQSELSNREQFGLVLKEFMSREKYRRGHVSFINMALERMPEFQLEQDLLTYNRLLDVFPKGRYKPKRLLDALWPRPLPQTELALELLTRMEDYNVWPDEITYSLLVEVFGRHSLPVEKCERMAYWYQRFKDADPYWIEGEVPTEPLELSRLALKRITDNNNIVEYQVAADGGSGFILGGHSKAQLDLLHQMRSCEGHSGLLYVEGPHRIWINKSPISYFSLRLPAGETVQSHHHGEGAVVAVCACQPSTQASLQQWIRELQLAHPQLTDATIVYDIRTDSGSSPLLEDGRVTLAGSLEEPATT